MTDPVWVSFLLEEGNNGEYARLMGSKVRCRAVRETGSEKTRIRTCEHCWPSSADHSMRFIQDSSSWGCSTGEMKNPLIPWSRYRWEM